MTALSVLSLATWFSLHSYLPSEFTWFVATVTDHVGSATALVKIAQWYTAQNIYGKVKS